jgi:anti-sigma B factor antagonist
MAHFNEQTDDDLCVIRVAGEVDIASTEEFLALATDGLDRCRHLRLDLGEVSFMDSSGLGILLRIRRLAADSGKRLTLASLGAGTRRILQVTGVHQLFEVEGDTGDVRASG